MIKHRKIIISFLLAYALFIVGIFNVRADTYLRTTKISESPTNLVLSISQPEYKLFSITSFNTGNADYVLIPASLGIFGTDKYGNVGQPGQWAGHYQMLTIQPYLLGTNGTDAVPCELVSNGFKCKVVHNGDYNAFGVWNNLNQNWNLYTDVWIAGTFDNNWQLYSSTEDSIANNTNDINNSINDSSIDSDNTDSSVSGFSSSTNSSMSNTPVSSMISLPITFLTGVNNALSNSCTNVNYIELFGYQLVLPCLNLSERLGSVWTIIDTIFSCMLIFSIGKSLVSTFARLSDMDTNIMYECYGNGTKHRGESFDD